MDRGLGSRRSNPTVAPKQCRPGVVGPFSPLVFAAAITIEPRAVLVVAGDDDELKIGVGLDEIRNRG